MILLDSSFVIAFYSELDNNHKQARELMKRIAAKEYGDLFISDYVIDEVSTVIMKRLGVKTVTRICKELLNAAYLVNIDDDMFYKTFDIFQKQRGTTLSFTDCSNIAIIEEKGIRNLAAFDSDFKHFARISTVP